MPTVDKCESTAMLSTLIVDDSVERAWMLWIATLHYPHGCAQSATFSRGHADLFNIHPIANTAATYAEDRAFLRDQRT